MKERGEEGQGKKGEELRRRKTKDKGRRTMN